MHYLFGGNFGGERLVSGSVHKVFGFTSSIAILFEAKKCITVKLKARCLSDTWTWQWKIQNVQNLSVKLNECDTKTDSLWTFEGVTTLLHVPFLNNHESNIS